MEALVPHTHDAETLGVTSTTVPTRLTAGKLVAAPSPPRATVTAEGGPMRFYCHSTAADDVSTTDGHLLYDGDEVDLQDSDLANFAIVKTTSTNGSIVVSYQGGE